MTFRPGLYRTHDSSLTGQNNLLSPVVAATAPTVAPATIPTSTECLKNQLRDCGVEFTGCARSAAEPGRRLGSGGALLTLVSIGSPSPLNLDGRVARSTMSENPCGGSSAAVGLADNRQNKPTKTQFDLTAISCISDASPHPTPSEILGSIALPCQPLRS